MSKLEGCASTSSDSAIWNENISLARKILSQLIQELDKAKSYRRHSQLSVHQDFFLEKIVLGPGGGTMARKFIYSGRKSAATDNIY
jgi:hypothetical protein